MAEKIKKKLAEKQRMEKIKFYLTSSNLEDIKADKNKIIKELKELDKSSSLTNKIISKRNAEKNKDILIFIKKRIVI